MPVQPMKSIAAVAISKSHLHLTVPQIMAAEISTAAVLLLLGATGLMSLLYRLLPLPVVRGVHLTQGLSFAFTAIKYIRYDQNLSTSKSTGPRPFLGLDSLLLVRAAVPQILLSILKSVIAVCKLSTDLFPDRPVVTTTAVSTSVGLMNLVGCWFGAMPVCHGAGGLAGQYRFGGRSGASVLFLPLKALEIHKFELGPNSLEVAHDRS